MDGDKRLDPTLELWLSNSKATGTLDGFLAIHPEHRLAVSRNPS
jgi:hypothetical protein